MKTLFLIRHAKSSWDDTALPDKDRPLGDRSRRDAPKMGKRLAKRDVKPDLILSSPARRALTTAEIVAKKLDYKLKDIVVDDRLYAGAVHDLLNVIHKVGDKLERVMLFGHNPELTELAHRLSSEITHMPTCAVAEFTFNAMSWSNIGKACTFCRDCVETRLGGRCPDCGGGLEPRPIRRANKLERFPPSDLRVFKPEGCSSPPTEGKRL